MYQVLCAILLVSCCNFSYGQYFKVNNDATDNGGGCYELTPFAKGKMGSIWSQEKISLTESFSISGKINFGPNYFSGADGIAFALQRTSNTGGASGAGLGVGNITPSLVVEFDTYRNGYDPRFDHVAIIKDGVSDHNSGHTLNGPVQIKDGVNNVKTNDWLKYRIKWDATTQTLTVYIDCKQRVSYSGSVIQDIFGGDPNVFWGFSSATGDKFNRHSVCIESSNLSSIEDEEICKGEIATTTLDYLGESYSLNSWSPTTGILDHTAPNPTFQPSVTTEYILTLTDECNNETKDTFNVEVKDAPIVDLGKDKTVCAGSTVQLDAGNPGLTFKWNSGETNQTITAGSGNHNVEVTNSTGCIGRDTIIVSSGGELTVDIGPADTLFCSAFSLLLDAGNSGAAYTWNTGASSQSITVSTAGTYFVEVNNGGCIGHDTIIVSNSINSGLNLGSDTSLCAGTTFKTGSNSSLTKLWNDGSSSDSLVISSAGIYWLELGTNTNCPIRDSIIVSNINNPIVDLGDRNQSTCSGGNISFDASNTGLNFLWNDGSTGQQLNASTDGTYFVKVTDPNTMCFAADTVTLTIQNNLAVDIGTDIATCLTVNETLDAGNAGSSFLWSDGSSNQQVNVTSTGSYSVIVTDPQGCKGYDTIAISLVICPKDLILKDTIEICEGDVANINAIKMYSSTWSSTATFTLVNDSSITTSPNKTSTYYVVDSVRNQEFIVNGDFESPGVTNFATIDASSVDGWNTTASDNMIEVWTSGFQGVPSYSGNQFIELNANMPSALYQDMTTVPGELLRWEFAHRGFFLFN